MMTVSETPASQFDRTVMLLGQQSLDILKESRVAVFGIGGVGGYVCEALARSGVGSLVLIDKDKVDITNINRQIIATHETVGRLKTEVMTGRIRSINPECSVTAHDIFYLPETEDSVEFDGLDYVVDAVDTVTAKLLIITRAKEAGVPVISSMGTGNKLDPTRFKVADINKTNVCPLAKVMRRELRSRGIDSVKVVYSDEEPVSTGSRTPGSVAFVPSVAGFIIAGEVIKDIIRERTKE
ncbi:tRNA A37 threonylcarbamoyladenosine dehydratase [Ruminococcaceae bacterium YRB3002]|nr:tRNA A37 threonylcarbamoyladenosine dehydratase [Ruminococcaceae bacterium YRB3002]